MHGNKHTLYKTSFQTDMKIRWFTCLSLVTIKKHQLSFKGLTLEQFSSLFSCIHIERDERETLETF